MDKDAKKIIVDTIHANEDYSVEELNAFQDDYLLAMYLDVITTTLNNVDDTDAEKQIDWAVGNMKSVMKALIAQFSEE